MDRVVALPLSTVERAGTGDLVTRTTRDVDALSHTVRFAVPSVLVAVVATVLTADRDVRGRLEGRAAGAARACRSCGLGTRWYLKRAPAGYLREGATYAVLNGTVTETVDGARTVEALGLGAERRRAVDRDLAELLQAERYTLFLRTVWFPSVEFGYFLPVAATLLWGGWLAGDGPGDASARSPR